jgi:hypothetical protein
MRIYSAQWEFNLYFSVHTIKVMGHERSTVPEKASIVSQAISVAILLEA